MAHKDQKVDATFVETPRLHNKRKENALIKGSAIPIEWSKDEHEHAQKVTYPRWTKKNYTNYYDYKNHVISDHTTKL